MADLDYVRAMLYAKNIDSNNVKPYTGLHFNSRGNSFFCELFADKKREINKL